MEHESIATTDIPENQGANISNSEIPEAVDIREESEKSEKLVQLPLSRVKHIMKMDPDVQISSQEAVFLITKAAELFLGSLSTEAYRQAAQAKRKTIQRKDIDAAIDCIDSLAFLEGVLESANK